MGLPVRAELVAGLAGCRHYLLAMRICQALGLSTEEVGCCHCCLLCCLLCLARFCISVGSCLLAMRLCQALRLSSEEVGQGRGCWPLRCCHGAASYFSVD